jgi:histidine kinase/histidine kinase/DNA gyrase B/HSP90-like ATPase
MPQKRRFVAYFWSFAPGAWYGEVNMNPRFDSGDRPGAPARPWGTNVLHGLTGRRLMWALLINAVVAIVGAQVYIWQNVEQAMVSAQIVGLSIMLSWTLASNLRLPWLPPLSVQLLSIVAGSALGTVIVVLVKGYIYDYDFGHVLKDPEGAIGLLVVGIVFGGFVILTVIAREREARAQATLHQAEAERHLHGKQLLEAKLQLMQAQIEPHFLFNTLASVQHLMETDPPAASRMLSDLTKYLRAAMPQMRDQRTTLGRETELARAYLSIQRVRSGCRFDFSVDLPESLRQEPFPPMMLLTLVENAVKHGFEAHSLGGEIRVAAHAEDDALAVSVLDTGAGLSTDRPEGIGLSNVRERLAALYGSAGRLVLEQNKPRGVHACIVVPRAERSTGAAGSTSSGDPGAHPAHAA